MSELLYTAGPSNVDTLLATTLGNYRDTLEDNVFTAFPLTMKLMENKRKRLVGGGTSVWVPILSGKNNTAAWYSGWTALDVTPQEGMTMAQYKWAELADSVGINEREENQNSGQEQLINLIKAKTLQAEKSLVDKFATGLWSSTQITNAIVPLNLMVDATSTVGDINSTTQAFWQATSTASGSFAAQGLKDMRTLYNTLSKNRKNDHPDLVIATQTIFESYENTLQSQQRYIDAKKLDGGFEAFAFKNSEFFFDENAISGQLYMLNTKYLELVVHRNADMAISPFVKPVNQTGRVAQIRWMGAFVTDNRRMLGKLTGVTA